MPSVILARLAVDNAAQGQGLGETLLVDAFRRTLGLSGNLCIHVIEVDAIDEQARAFYEKFGFVRLTDQPFASTSPSRSSVRFGEIVNLVEFRLPCRWQEKATRLQARGYQDMGLLYARLHEDIYKRFLSKISENSWYLSESQRNSWKPWKTQLVIPHALAAFWKPNVLPSCESPRRPPPRWRLEHPDILSRDRPARAARIRDRP